MRLKWILAVVVGLGIASASIPARAQHTHRPLVHIGRYLGTGWGNGFHRRTPGTDTRYYVPYSPSNSQRVVTPRANGGSFAWPDRSRRDPSSRNGLAGAGALRAKQPDRVEFRDPDPALWQRAFPAHAATDLQDPPPIANGTWRPIPAFATGMELPRPSELFPQGGRTGGWLPAANRPMSSTLAETRNQAAAVGARQRPNADSAEPPFQISFDEPTLVDPPRDR